MIGLIRKLIKGRSVLILGYGREGRSSWRLIKEAGGYTRAAVADIKKIIPDESDPCEIISGPDYQKCMDDFDIVFKSPGIVLERDIKSYRCEIVSETELFMRRYGQRCIGITGTKGKSTTTSLVYHILKETGHDCIIAGNIGVPLFDITGRMDENTLAVCELSSHQLEYLSTGPHIGVLLNIHEEHLDHYGTMEKYTAAKQNIYRTQREGDILVCNALLKPGEGTCASKVITVYDEGAEPGRGLSDEPDDCRNADIILRGSCVIDKGHTYVIPDRKIHLKGHHNDADIAFAYAVCSMLGVSDDDFTAALSDFKPLPHRLEYIGDRDGVHYYDDSISTIGDTAIWALMSIPDTDAVIIGGMDRGIDYKDLIMFLSECPVPHIILMEDTGARIMREIGELYPDFDRPERVIYTEHLKQAVSEAEKVCRPGRSCVLSPAAASYGIYKNFEERGDDFRRLVLGDSGTEA